nr:ribonuclease H-like domain-containing protein [Tanacetum cinerariifolium]
TVEDKILVPKPPKNCARCTRYGYLVDGLHCQGCALLRQELEESLVTHSPDFQNTSEPSNESTNVVNAPREPYVVKQDNGSIVDEIIFYLNRALDSPNQFHCFHYKDVLRDGEACKRCTCAKCGSGLGKGLSYICGHNQNSLNDSPSISETSSQSPPNINHCCYECGDPLNGIFCKRCTIIPMEIDQHSFNAEPDLVESMPNHDSSIIIPSKIDSLFDEFAGELTLLKSFPSGIDETDCHPKEELRFAKRLLYDKSSPRPPEEIVSDNSNADIESFSPSPIPNEDSDSHIQEIDLYFNPDDPMPPGMEDYDDDSERDMPILDEFPGNYSLSLPANKSYHFDIPLPYHPPAKPPDGNTGTLNIKMLGDVSDQKPSAECSMIINGKNTPVLDVPLFHFYPLDQLNGTVKFYETVFPFKMRNINVNEKADADYASDANHLTFFDNQLTQSPYDEERATSVVEGSPSFSKTDNDFTRSSENGTATQFEDNNLSEGSLFEKNSGSLFVPTLNLTANPIESMQFEPRRSSRVSKLPTKLNYYVVDSEVERYKARLVAKGFSQKEGFDYDETFSHVVKMVTVRCVITMAASYSWPMYQLDANNTFLYGDLVEDVYMTLPLGFGNNSDNKVYKLNKSLYRFKQAPRQWNAKLTAALVEHGFVQSKFDYSLFIKETGDVFVFLLVYVDDIVIIENCKESIESFKLF